MIPLPKKLPLKSPVLLGLIKSQCKQDLYLLHKSMSCNWATKLDKKPSTFMVSLKVH